MRKLPKKKQSTKRSHKISTRFLKGKIGVGVVVVLCLVLGLGIFLVGGIAPEVDTPTGDPIAGSIISGTPIPSHRNLQLDTFKLQECASKVAIDFLVDDSLSMAFGNQYGTKVANLKNALNTFASVYPKEGIVALQDFTSQPINGQESFLWQPLVPFDTFANNKALFISAVNALTPLGGTPTKYAFQQTKPVLLAAKAKYPSQKIALVFISDGIPETGANNGAHSSTTSYICPATQDPLCEQAYTPTTHSPQGCRCFDLNQDPTSVAKEIKDAGIRIFTIGYVAQEDSKFQNPLQDLMKRVASSPSDYFPAPINNQIYDILKQITVKFCE